MYYSFLQTGEEHTVTQMQYIDWPDHGKNKARGKMYVPLRTHTKWAPTLSSDGDST